MVEKRMKKQLNKEINYEYVEYFNTKVKNDTDKEMAER